MKKIFKTIIQFLLNPRLLLCFAIAWMITNGWSYVLLALSTYFQIGWLVTIASAYLAFLWLPVSPEKIVTVAIAMALMRRLFPDDEKTLGLLRQLHQRVKATGRKSRRAANQLLSTQTAPVPGTRVLR